MALDSLSLEQWVQITTIIALFVALSTLAWQVKGQRNQLKEDKKSRSAEIASNFNQQFSSEPFLGIQRTISYSDFAKKPLSIRLDIPTNIKKFTINEFDFINYLVKLETLSLFINEENIDEKYAYELFSSEIFTLFKNVLISKYIEENIIQQSDNHDQLVKAHARLLKYKNNKLKDQIDESPPREKTLQTNQGRKWIDSRGQVYYS